MNDAGYRSGLEAAKERVRQLEGELAAMPKRPDRPQRSALFLGAGFVVGALVALFGVLRVQGWRPAPTSATAGEDPWAEQASVALDLHLARERDVLLSDLNGDGALDLVTFFWDASHPSTPLHVVAFDHSTFSVLWHAGPFPADAALTGVRLDRAKTAVLVTDGHGDLHALAASNGHPVSMESPPEPQVLPEQGEHPEKYGIFIVAEDRSYALHDGALHITDSKTGRELKTLRSIFVDRPRTYAVTSSR